MKKGALFAVLILFAKNVVAQESIFESVNLNVLEQLISLAKENYPERKIIERNEAEAKSRLSAAKVSHIDILNVSYYYRPGNRTVADPNNPFIFNGLQLGISLSPGRFVQRIYQVREARATHEIAQLKTQQYETALENEVKSLYYDYVMSLEEIKNQTQRSQDAEAFLEDSRLRFEKGEMALSDYISARDDVSSASLRLRQAEVGFLKVRDSLEELVGVDLATITAP